MLSVKPKLSQKKSHNALPIIKYLEEKQIILKNIKEYVGCSIGAFCALLMILGYSSSTLIDIFSKYQSQSQLISNDRYPLFQIETLGAGNVANTKIKVGISTNLR